MNPFFPLPPAPLTPDRRRYSVGMKTIILVLSVVAALSGCAGSGREGADMADSNVSTVSVSMRTSAGEIVLELDKQRAPISVANFLVHAQRGDYDGTIFHRVIPTFVVQGGGFTPDLKDRGAAAKAAGNEDPKIKNEWTNGLKNVRGTIAMARDTQPDTATREFYINVADNARLDTAREKTGNAGYAVFGHVVRGMDIVDRIKEGKTMDRPDVIVDGEGMKDVPVEPVVIERVKVGMTR